MNTTVQTKKNRKEFWFNHIKKWQASGKTQVDYCKINKLNERTFSSRKKSLMSPKKELESPLLFHPIKESKSKFKKKNIFKIKLSNGMELSFEETPNPIWFGKLISGRRLRSKLIIAMFNFEKFDNIYFFRPVVDFRKGINGLCGIVQDEMKLNPFEKYLFIFCNSKRNKIKALYWDKTGFALWFKALEAEKYRWPQHLEGDVLTIEVKKLNKFLIGYDPWQIGHKNLNFSFV